MKCKFTLQVVCSHLSQADLSDMELLHQLHDAINVYYNYTGSAACLSINETSVGSLQVTGWDFQVVCLVLLQFIATVIVNEKFFMQFLFLTRLC